MLIMIIILFQVIMYYTLTATLLLASITPWCDAAGRSKPITTSLDAKWKAHPVALEAAECLAEKSNDDFWAWVDVTRDIPTGNFKINSLL